MIISFSNIPFVLACAVGALIVLTHCASAFLQGGLSRFATMVGVGLHLFAFVLLFFAGAELDVLVTCLMVSVFVYTLLNYVSYLMNKKGDTGK